MAILPILQFPDPRLKLVAKPTESFDASLIALVDDLFETMYDNEGVGLAATQVNVLQRICVIDFSEHQDEGKCLINPVIVDKKGEVIKEEGCLSFPNVYAKVKRYSEITVEYYDVEGDKQTMQADDWISVCIQHEIDHLDGITFFDHLSPLKQNMIRKKLDKQRDRVS